MNQVFAKTRELGQALLECEEYRHMKTCEENAMKNTEAALLMGQYLEKQGELEQLMNAEHPLPERLAAVSLEIDAYREKLNAVPDIQKLTEAQSAFSNVIDQVNQEKKNNMSGQMSLMDLLGEEEKKDFEIMQNRFLRKPPLPQ